MEGYGDIDAKRKQFRDVLKKLPVPDPRLGGDVETRDAHLFYAAKEAEEQAQLKAEGTAQEFAGLVKSLFASVGHSLEADNQANIRGLSPVARSPSRSSRARRRR